MSTVLKLQQAPGFDGYDKGQKVLYVFFTIVFSGNYTTGGDTFDLTSLAPLEGVSQLPLNVSISSQNPSGMSGFFYDYRPGTNLSNGKVQVSQTGNNNPKQEISQAGYPAGVTGDTVVGVACFVYGS